MKKFLKFFYFSVCAFAFFTTQASAYIDPSTMTYLIQVIAGVFIAGGAAAGILWHKVKRAVKKPKNAEAVQENETSVDTQPNEDEAD